MKRILGVLIVLASVAAAETSAVRAQDTAGNEIANALAVLNNVQALMIVVVVVIALLLLAGGFLAYMQLRQMQRTLRDQRTKLAELQVLYRDLQGARKRTEAALAAVETAPVEANGRNGQLDPVVRSALARMTQAAGLLTVGETQYRAQDYLGALATYTRAAELDEMNALIHYRAGYINIQVNQLDRAMRHLNLALDLDSQFLPAQAALGYLYRRMAEHTDVDERQRGTLYEEADRYLSAALQSSRRLMDEDGEPWLGTLAGVYRRRRQLDLAILAYQEAAEITPFSAYPYASLAFVYADKADYTQMYKNFERVEWRARNESGARPASPWGHANLLLARLALGRDDKLIEEEFTLTFLSLPKDGAFVLPTISGSLRRLEWALASSGQPARAERVSHLMQRIERLEATSNRLTSTSTQVMRRPASSTRRTETMPMIDDGGGSVRPGPASARDVRGPSYEDDPLD